MLHIEYMHLLDFQVDTPQHQVVGRLLARQVSVLSQVLLTVLVSLQHSEVLDALLVFLLEGFL